MKLRDTFPEEQLRHRNVKGRDETWVPAEWIIHRLIETGVEYDLTGEIHALEDCKVWENKEWVEGVRAAVSVELLIDGRTFVGFGAATDSGTDQCDALKSAHSYAVRHAAKCAGIGLHLWTHPTNGAVHTAPAKAEPEALAQPPAQEAPTQAPQVSEPQDAGLVCGGCGSKAVLRTVKKAGKNQGRKFWTCPKRECNDLFEWADDVEEAVPF
tara:strand:- start:547 stop:1182 length:636 start_codon:yes stop_codon:yes gene_type:complete